MSDKPIGPCRAGVFAALYPELVRVARENGYALAIHGSLVRDFDLVAIPWVEDAKPALELILALKYAAGGCFVSWATDEFFPEGNPTAKPHGRFAYSIHLTDEGCHGPYIDVSVMPRKANG